MILNQTKELHCLHFQALLDVGYIEHETEMTSPCFQTSSSGCTKRCVVFPPCTDPFNFFRKWRDTGPFCIEGFSFLPNLNRSSLSEILRRCSLPFAALISTSYENTMRKTACIAECLQCWGDLHRKLPLGKPFSRPLCNGYLSLTLTISVSPRRSLLVQYGAVSQPLQNAIFILAFGRPYVGLLLFLFLLIYSSCILSTITHSLNQLLPCPGSHKDPPKNIAPVW